MTKARDLANLISTGNALSDGAISVSEITDLTASAAELNKLDGVTASTAELNQVVGATSALQTQLDNISVTSGSLTKTFTQNETADITLSQSITSAPVVSATKEVPQTGISTKGNWDVNSTASNYDFHDTAANVTLTPSTITNGSAYGTTPVSGTSSVNKTFGGVTDIRGIAFKPDGTKMIILQQSNAEMKFYNLTTAWDITSSGSPQTSRNHNSYLNGSGLGMTWKPDGLRSYIPDYGANFIKEFVYVTAWDPSSYSTNYTYSFGSTDFIDIAWGNNGYKLYLIKYGGTLHQFTCSSAYDLSTATSEVSYTPSSGSASFMSVEVAHDGSAIYIGTHNTSYHIIKVSMSTAYDLSTASDSVHLVTQSGHNNFGLIKFEDSGNRYYWNDYSSGTLNYVQPAISAAGLVLGSGSFASTDVGKRIVGNGGDVVLTATNGAFTTTGGSAFTDNSTIAAGSWQMFGLKSAGDVSGITMAGFSQTGSTFNTNAPLIGTSQNNYSNLGGYVGFVVSQNGLHAYGAKQSNGQIDHYTMSTAFDVTTISLASDTLSSGYTMSASDTHISSDGTKVYATNNNYPYSGDHIKQWTLSTPYDLSTAGSPTEVTFNGGGQAAATSNGHGGQLDFSPDGTKLYYAPYAHWTGNSTHGDSHPTNTASAYSNSGLVFQYTLSTAYDITGTKNYDGVVRVPFKGNSYASICVTSDGKYLINTKYNGSDMFIYPLTTAFDITTATHTTEQYFNTSAHNSSGGQSQGGISISHVDGKLFNYYYGGSRVDVNAYGTGLDQFVPTQQYHVGVTNTSGRIDSSAFIDINSMTAAQSAGTGTAHYAVSTDGRTTWSVAKGTDGVRPIVRNNSGTWQYNSENSTTTTTDAISTSTLTATVNFATASYQTARNIRSFFNNDGTRLYIYGYNNEDLVSYALSTAYDISTKGTHLQSVNLGQSPYNLVNGFGPIWNNNGTKLYYPDHTTVKELAVSTAYDLSAISSTPSHTLTPSNFTGQMAGITWKPDGTKLYIVEDAGQGSGGGGQIHIFTLSTAYDLSTASFTSKTADNYFTHSGATFTSFAFADSGSTIYILDRNNATIRRYSLATAWDVTNATYLGTSYDISLVTGNSNDHCSITIDNNDGVLLVSDYGSHNTFQYTPATTTTTAYNTTPVWTNGTVNDELYTLQQALSVTMNRMDKTQLDAVADANHFSTGNSLDLMIALRMDTAASTLPTSDGVTLNYDAAALNEGAILGTDYDFFFPSSTKVQIKSLAAQNLKVRVV